MNENLLQFIWQNRFFRTGPYHCTDGILLEIINPGVHNFNQGPDFLNARIKLAKTEWAGNIELHVHSSDWYKHHHEKDPNFKNIILHVVWIDDRNIVDQFGQTLPTFCIQPYVSNLLLNKYVSLIQDYPFAKPCYSYLPAMSQLKWLAWKERLVLERLEKKTKKICQYLKEANQDWETITWWLLASNMGLKVNEHLFVSMARSVPIRILANHRNQIHQLEAILIGQCNLLNQPFDEQYPKMLQKEYRYLKNKYRLENIVSQPAFLRMRPASFPSIRLAQLAKMIHVNNHFFDYFKNAESISLLQKNLMIFPNDYWLYHYRFDDIGIYKEKKMGISMVNSILINTAIPLLFAYGYIKKESSFQIKAINWLMELGAERNCITNEWNSYKVFNKTSFDSQALIELNQSYCKEKHCLNCAVGVSILGNH